MKILAVAFGWLLCGFIALGAQIAYFDGEHPTVGGARDTKLLSALFFVCGPLGLIAATFCSRLFMHGLHWKYAHKPYCPTR